MAATIDAAQAGIVLLGPCPENALPEQQAWFRKANKVVFKAIFTAVSKHPVLVSKVQDLIGGPSSAYESWKVIKAYFIRQADTNRPYLQTKLRALQPNPGESMESFLSRCNDLRKEWEAYGIEMPDESLITQ